MDNLTHSLTGILLSRAGLNRFHKRATALLLLSANIPDADVVSVAFGWAPYMLYHRWYTHALLLMPLVALLNAAAVRLVFRKEPFAWKNAWLLSLIGVASHLVLDFTNAYGIRMLLPFSDEWPRLSITHVVDLWIWLMLAAAFAWPALSRLVSDEIGARRPRGRGLAVTVLLMLALYDTGRWVLHRRAIEAQENQTISGATPRRVFAVPQGSNPFRWRGIVETDTFFAVQDIDLLQEEPLLDTRMQYKPVASPQIEAALNTRVFQTFAKFSAVYMWRATPHPEIENATRVEAIDLQLGFTAIAAVDAQNRVLSTSVLF